MALNFIALIDVLAAIADRVKRSEIPCTLDSDVRPQTEAERAARTFWAKSESRIDEARRYAEAARLLNESLHNADETTNPNWLEYDKQLRFHTGEGTHGAVARRDGLEILKHATGAHGHQMNIIRSHVQSAPDAETEEPSLEVRFVIAPRSLPLSRPREVGFEREQLVSFLAAQGISHALVDGTVRLQAPRNEWPDERVLALLEEYGDGRRATQEELGMRHQVTRQFIGKMLKKARVLRDGQRWVQSVSAPNRRR